MGEKNVIHIFGASGAGTSTLGRYICEKRGWFFMDTDDYFWCPTEVPYTVKRPADERLRLMRGDIARHENSVISGSLTGWGDVLIPDFTLAVRVVTATKTRLKWLEARERKHFGARLDEGGDMYENHRAFMDWAAAYDDGGLDIRSRAEHDEWQKLLKCPLITVNGEDGVEKNFEIVRKSIKI